MVKAYLFDLDGVLVDTAKYHFIAWKKLADELNIPFTHDDNEKLKGVSRMDSLDIILKLGGRSLSTQEKNELADRKNKWFVDFVNGMSPSEIFPGVKELLAELKKRGLKVGLASSSKNAPAVLQLLGITSLFDAIVDGSMVTNAKPDPELFLLASEKLNTPPSECVVFEDAEAGVEAAKRAGMKCVGVGSVSILHQADFIVKQVADFKLTDLEKLSEVNTKA
jgi:beta-phosphoglucomutase